MSQGIKQKATVFIKKYPPLYRIARLLSSQYWRRRKPIRRKVKRMKAIPHILIGSNLRKLDWIDFPKYKKVKQLKNFHEGKRCFIICTGPSLRIDDLEKLKDEICISMNSIVYLFDKTDWRPLYYSAGNLPILDEPIEKAVKAGELKNIFLAGRRRKRPYEKYPNVNIFRLPGLQKPHGFKIGSNGEVIPPRDFILSDNLYVGVGGGASSGVGKIQHAAYMGFKEVYFYGADCDYSGKKKYFDGNSGEYSPDSVYTEEIINRASKIITYGHKMAKEFAEARGIKVFNATRGGALEVYERVDLDEVLSSERI